MLEPSKPVCPVVIEKLGPSSGKDKRFMRLGLSPVP